MTPRDRKIVEDLKQFRILSRDHVVNLHFSHCRQPEKEANKVLKRLCRDDYITPSTERRMYMYQVVPPPLKKDSAKLNHYLALADFYIECRKVEQPRQFIVEPKYGKGNPEPDISMIWLNTPFWVEVQRSIYSDKVMTEKMERYERYYDSEEWKQFDWQPADRKIFPRVWIVTEHQYHLETPFKVIQTRSVDDFLKKIKK